MQRPRVTLSGAQQAERISHVGLMCALRTAPRALEPVQVSSLGQPDNRLRDQSRSNGGIGRPDTSRETGWADEQAAVSRSEAYGILRR